MHCALCARPVDLVSSSWRWLLDFVKLYSVGILELFRQWLFSKPQHSLGRRAYSEQLALFRTVRPIVLLTGCTSGIGLEILQQLSSIGLQIIAITHTVDALLPVNCEQITMDLSCKRSTLSGIAAVSTCLGQADPERPVILIHCAAIFHPRATSTGSDFSSPVINTLLVNLLMPCLFINGISHLLSGIVWIGSSSQIAAPKIQNVSCPLHTARTPFSMYPLSKLLAVVYAEHWSQTNAKPVAVIHPGVVATGLYRDERGFIGKILRLLIPTWGWSAASSASRVLQLVQRGGLLERKRGLRHTVMCADSGGVYWDTVCMGEGAVPVQIRDPKDRATIARKLCHALESDVF